MSAPIKVGRKVEFRRGCLGVVRPEDPRRFIGGWRAGLDTSTLTGVYDGIWLDELGEQIAEWHRVKVEREVDGETQVGIVPVHRSMIRFAR